MVGPAASPAPARGGAGVVEPGAAPVAFALRRSVAATTEPAPITGTPSAANQPGPPTNVQAPANARAKDSALS